MTYEVLPTIRKQGAYVATRKEDSIEEIMARAMKAVKTAVEKKQQQRIFLLEKENEKLKLRIKIMKTPIREVRSSINRGLSQNQTWSNLLELAENTL